MFGLKKKGRERIREFQNAVKDQFSPILSSLSEKLRLRSRIRLANRWASRHPKRLMLYYSIVSLVLIGVSIISYFSETKDTEKDILKLHSLPAMSHRLQSLNNTEIKNERIRQEINALGQKGMEIYNELDSLMNLPVKTHSDSVRIIANYNILNKTFNANGHEL